MTLSKNEILDQIEISIAQEAKALEVLIEVRMRLADAKNIQEVMDAQMYLHNNKEHLESTEYQWLTSVVEDRIIPYFMEKENV